VERVYEESKIGVGKSILGENVKQGMRREPIRLQRCN
jgi:hypothetical protein